MIRSGNQSFSTVRSLIKYRKWSIDFSYIDIEGKVDKNLLLLLDDKIKFLGNRT